jgi:hypothetical protein
MTPTEKADQLCLAMLSITEWQGSVDKTKEVARNCAIIAVEEIIKAKKIPDPLFWKQVKQKIESI